MKRLRLTYVMLSLALSALVHSPGHAQRSEIPALPDANRTLSEADARRLLDTVVAAINRNFFDTEKLAKIGFAALASEAAADVAAARTPTEAAARLNRLLAKLETSHTQVFTPDEPEFYFIADVFSANRLPTTWAAPNLLPGTGFFTAKFGGRDHVTAVLQGSPADTAGIRVGDEIVSVDGAPYHPVHSFRQKHGEAVEVAIRRTKDGAVETRSATVIPIQPSKAFDQAMQASARVIERNGKRIGYIQVWHMRSDDALAEALARLDPSRRSYRGHDGRFNRGSQSNNAATRSEPPLDALVIDNRGKIGGSATVAQNFLSVLAGPRGGHFEAFGRDSRPRPLPSSFKGRTVMLIDGGTRSAGEIFAQGFKTEALGPLFGTRTAGAVSAGGFEMLPGGLLLYLATARVTLDGVNLEGAGVTPTREIPRPIPYSAGADPVLDAAIAHLAGD